MLQFAAMSPFADFLDLNRPIIYFVYGLVFFILGFAILLQARKNSRLELAKTLRWLAAFGLAHGFYEWGEVFIPIQMDQLTPQSVRFLELLQLILLAGSYSFLMQFGVALLSMDKPRAWARWLTAFLFTGWLIATIYIIPAEITDERLWRYPSNAFARYFIGFPGGLLAAYGLRQYALLRIKPLNVPRIFLTLQVAGITLGIYALLSGLIPPPVDFFPGNILNRVTFTEFIGIPPLIFRSLTGVILVFTFVRALEIFDVETARRIEELEQRHILAAERERLARDLHDGAIQKVYTAGLLVESATRLADSNSEIRLRLEKSVLVLNDAIADLRRNLSELQSDSTNSLDSLPSLLRQIGNDPYYSSLVTIELTIDLPEDKGLLPIRTSHTLAIVNEAMANIVRHAQAQKVEIQARDLDGQLCIVIKDDGVGFPPEHKAGYGLRNMRDRARLLNGNLTFTNNQGTTVTLTLPWMDQ
jgi:signal transduction histidine kinase